MGVENAINRSSIQVQKARTGSCTFYTESNGSLPVQAPLLLSRATVLPAQVVAGNVYLDRHQVISTFYCAVVTDDTVDQLPYSKAGSLKTSG